MLKNDYYLANQLPLAVLLIDKNNSLIWWNTEAEIRFKIAKPSSTALFLKDIFPTIDFSAYLHEKNSSAIELLLNKNPETWVNLSVIPYDDDHYLFLFQDVTHVHHLERMRQDFVANVSHELRTPLTVIHGYLEMLLEKEKINKEMIDVVFNQMHQQSLRMRNLIEDLLLLSRLENAEPENSAFKLINMEKLLRSIIADAKALSGERNHQINLNLQTAQNLLGIEDELRSIFANIIFNAVNYTPANGHITITWANEKNNLTLSVADTGIGIAEEHIPRLTERFYRVDRARSRESGGTGLGLAIVKHALLRHKANLKITSELGKGSVFTCVFSLSHSEE